MDQISQDHVETAEENDRLARSLLAPAMAEGLPRPPCEWATVIGFYAAVHYVNAYLWERHGIAPRDHTERAYHVRHDRILRRCALAYARLADAGYKSRYIPRFRIAPARAYQLVHVDLANVWSVVLAAM